MSMATLLLTAGASTITADAAVLAHMRKVLPLMLATLATHGTAVTLEGVLLAQKAFRALSLTYTGVALSVAALLALVRRSAAVTCCSSTYAARRWLAALLRHVRG